MKKKKIVYVLIDMSESMQSGENVAKVNAFMSEFAGKTVSAIQARCTENEDVFYRVRGFNPNQMLGTGENSLKWQYLGEEDFWGLRTADLGRMLRYSVCDMHKDISEDFDCNQYLALILTSGRISGEKEFEDFLSEMKTEGTEAHDWFERANLLIVDFKAGPDNTEELKRLGSVDKYVSDAGYGSYYEYNPTDVYNVMNVIPELVFPCGELERARENKPLAVVRAEEADPATLSFEKRIKTALGILTGSYLADFDVSAVDVMFADKNLDAKQRENVYAAGIVFYVMSGGRYPHEFFGSDGRKEYIRFTEKGAEFRETVRNVAGNARAAEANRLMETTQKEIQKRDLERLASTSVGVGAVKIFELLWKVFVGKYANFNTDFWIKKLTEFSGKKYRISGEEIKQECENAELYAVSYEGQLDKPGHVRCEDASYAVVYGEKTWLIAEADGVGSCINSSLGSSTAVYSLADVLGDFVRESGIERKRVSDGDWAKAMYFFRFELAKRFYDLWESRIKNSSDYRNAPVADVGGFATTLQFAFGCEKFIVCGGVGDGTFYVRKREPAGGKEYLYGGFMLNDGISGVTTHAVCNVQHLKNNPNLMRISFFDAAEVTDVFISSDGVSNAVGESVVEAERTVSELSALPYKERCESLKLMARACSDCNETACGSGDDCTVVYAHIKHVA